MFCDFSKKKIIKGFEVFYDSNEQFFQLFFNYLIWLLLFICIMATMFVGI